MKLDIIYDQDSKQPSGINTIIEQSSDYPILYKLLKVGDTIKTKIRRKDKSLKTPIFYAIVELIVENIEYIRDPTDTIHINGKISQSDNLNVKEGTKQSIWITDGCELQLIKSNWDENELSTIDEILHPKSSKVKVNELASPVDLQNKCFDILHKYMAKKFDYVTYGKETLEALENGAVNVLFVTEEFIERQDDQWKNPLSSADHKYHGANIVVYNQGSANWEELTNFGGIIGVLKYIFIPPSSNSYN
ncbi:hypothetical protein M9Y10_019002 [Tritrichomonas musculus]|uniref:Uncharacterized protein n=1 Tax=Tritrichomonas musculus TaxID=1915356 RepID=A0ABR2HIB9_9EUKA